jgi:hypothetical protein
LDLDEFEKFPLFQPGEWKLRGCGKLFGGQFWRLGAGEDRPDDVRRKVG